MQKTAEKENININQFKENVDAWIKQIRTEFSQFKPLPKIVNEGLDNIQHNYELVRGLQQELEELRQELKLMRAMQFILVRKIVK